MSGKRKNIRKKGKTPNASPTPTMSTKRKYSTWEIVLGIGALIGVVFGAIAATPTIKEYFKTPKEKYEDATFEKGVLNLPDVGLIDTNGYSRAEKPPIFYSTLNDTLPIIKGVKINTIQAEMPIGILVGNIGYIVPLINLVYGVEIPIIRGCDCGKITFGLWHNRLFVSTEFKDLQKEETIGVIEYNHWKLYKQNMFDFHNGDNYLEVIDKQGNIVFSIKSEMKGKCEFIYVNGYFINPNSISIVSTTLNNSPKGVCACISKSDYAWKQKAQDSISLIKPIMPNTD
jgi:hypothetical protein